jgi:hypothetical protein
MLESVLLEEISSAFKEIWLMSVEILCHVSEIFVMGNASEELLNEV